MSDNIEKVILKYLKEGKTQAEISELLSAAGVKPNSLSSVEKKLKVIRENHGAKTMFHLGMIISRKDQLDFHRQMAASLQKYADDYNQRHGK